MKKSWDVIKVSKIQQLMVKYQCKVISIEKSIGEYPGWKQATYSNQSTTVRRNSIYWFLDDTSVH